MNWQLFDALGIFLGFLANLAVSHAGESSRPFAHWAPMTLTQVRPHGVGKQQLYVFQHRPHLPHLCLSRFSSLSNEA